jgi:hypothetical protein
MQIYEEQHNLLLSIEHKSLVMSVGKYHKSEFYGYGDFADLYTVTIDRGNEVVVIAISPEGKNYLAQYRAEASAKASAKAHQIETVLQSLMNYHNGDEQEHDPQLQAILDEAAQLMGFDYEMWRCSRIVF